MLGLREHSQEIEGAGTAGCYDNGNQIKGNRKRLDSETC